jgi:sugar lactone lactonase YvrE
MKTLTRCSIVVILGMMIVTSRSILAAIAYTEVPSWGPVPVSPPVEWEMGGVAASLAGDRLFLARRSDPPLLQMDPASGKVIRQWGDGLLMWPHSLYLDRDGFLWVSDATVADGPRLNLATAIPSAVRAGRGHQVHKLDRTGHVVMSLGTQGVSGPDEAHFNAPTSVAIARNGDIFVSDGHGGNTNTRVVVFSKDGRFLRTWGTKGSGAGQFAEPHGLALDSRERVLVADRSNGRIEVFDRDGHFIEQWMQFGKRPCAIVILPDDTMYVSSHSGKEENIVTIGSAKDGRVTTVVKDVVEGVDGIAVDKAGTIYLTSATGRAVRKMTPVPLMTR